MFTALSMYCPDTTYNQYSGTFNGAKIYFCHTSRSSLSTTFSDNYSGNTPVLVFSRASLVMNWSENAWNQLAFDTSFNYNGTDNLIIEIRWDSSPSGGLITGSTYPVSGKALLGGSVGATTGSDYPCRSVFQLAYSVSTATITPSVGSGSGTISPSSPVTLPSGGSTNFAIAASAHWHVSSIVTNGFSAYANSGNTGSASTNFNWANATGAGNTISASFAIDRYNLNVVSAWGTPTPTAGAHTYDYGTTVTNFVTSPSVQGTTQRVCTGWTGTGSVTPGSGTSTSFALGADSTITWLWSKTNYWLAVQTNGNGSVSGAASGWFSNATTVLLTASPGSHCHLANWTGTGLSGSDTNLTLSVTVNQAKTITANFSVEQFKLVVNSAQGGGVPPVGTNTLGYGFLTCSVTNSPKVVGGSTQYVCTGWTGTGNVSSGSGTNTALLLDTNSSITWLWTKTNYLLYVQTSGYGIVSGATNGWHTNGATAVLTAQQAPHCYFANWTGTGLSVPDTNLTISVAMNQARFMTANFSNDQYSLVVNSARGVCTPAPGTNTLNYGPLWCSMTNSPQVLGGTTQYVCTGWIGTGNVTNGAGTNTSFVLDTASSITWLWETTNYWLTVQTNGNGTVADVTNGWYANGTGLLPEAVPAHNWQLVNWTGTGLSGSDTNLTLSMTMNQARTITANFEATPGVWFVKANAGGADDGMSWANAFTNLQDAIAIALSNDQVWIAIGKYKPTTVSSDRSATFGVPNGVSLYGGFSGTETSLGQRNFSSNIVVLSGDTLGDDLNGFTNCTENVYHVVTVYNGAILDGCQVSGGYANGSGNDVYGAGVFIAAGGIVRNCTIATNLATYGGGCFLNSGGTVAASLIRNNKASTAGGGVYVKTSGIVSNCSIYANDGGANGGGVYLNMGGVVTHSSISRNTATTTGGGIRGFSGGRAKNCVVFRNTSATGGGVCGTSASVFDQCTIASNSASISGGGAYILTGGVVSNSIVYLNSATYSANCTNTGSTTYGYVCTYPLAAGTGNITNNPEFADVLHDDYHLKSATGRWVPSAGLWTNDLAHSPCIDAAAPTALYSSEPAPNGSRANMGAYGNTAEASKSAVGTVLLTVQNDGHGNPSPAGTTAHSPDSLILASVGGSPEADGSLTQYVCTGWTRAGSEPGSATGTNTSFTITSATTQTWLWVTNYWLAVAAEAHGAASTSNQWLRSGSNIVVTATASNYYHFGGWSGDTNACGVNSNQITVPMTRPRQITALIVTDLTTNDTPTWWLASFGLTNGPWAAEATNDFDHDGMPAWKEYQADTDPTDPKSLLAVTNITIEGSNVRIHWKGGHAAIQHLEARMALSSTSEQWMAIGINNPPTTTATNCVDSAGDAARFYRIRAERQ